MAISKGWPAILSSLKSMLESGQRARDPPRRASSDSKGLESHRSNIDNFKPAIVYTIYIASTPEKVWQALTISGIQPTSIFPALRWRPI